MEKQDMKFKIVVIAFLFVLTLAFLLLLSNRQKENVGIEGMFDNISNRTQSNFTEPFSHDLSSQLGTNITMPGNVSVDMPTKANITCTPYRLENILLVERGYTVKMEDKVMDISVYKAVPSSNGYIVSSKSMMSSEDVNVDVEMKWLFDKDLRCTGMEITAPFVGTNSYNGCYSYPLGIVCKELISDTLYNGTKEYSVMGRTYTVDVYSYEGFELGVGREIPILFYGYSKDKNISIELYYIKP
ncbi:MAG: hypothetical protein ACP5H8_02040 [Candidatus Micrarchaeia archaeon]